jgi:amidase
MAEAVDDICFASALELAELIRTKAISSLEVVDAYLNRIEALDPAVHAYIAVAADQAREAAKAVVGGPGLPPFAGVPIAVKGMIETAGLFTTFRTGSSWAGVIPSHDAAVVSKLKQAGFIVLGKTQVTNILGDADAPDSIAGPDGTLAPFGRCANPWNLEYSPGWSSGGAGAAVAAGLCPASVGADDGGSVRIPSAWCGLFGVKPSRGRVSAAPDPSAMYYTPGPLTHTVADGAALLDVMSGYVTGDGFWAPEPDHPFLDDARVRPPTLRIAFTTAAADGVSVAPAAIGAVEGTAKLLTELGHTVEAVDDWPGRGMFPDNRALGLIQIYQVKYAAWAELGLIPPAEEHESFVRDWIRLGREPRAVDLMKAMQLEAELARTIVGFFDRYDVLLTPVLVCQPFRLDRFDDHPEELVEIDTWLQFTGQFNQTGQPAVAVPRGTDDLGLPVGVQFVGGPADEATLLRLAAQLEEADPWRQRRPAGP